MQLKLIENHQASGGKYNMRSYGGSFQFHFASRKIDKIKCQKSRESKTKRRRPT